MFRKILIFLYSYVMPLDSYYVFSAKTCIVVIGMNTLRESTRKAEEEMENKGAH